MTPPSPQKNLATSIIFDESRYLTDDYAPHRKVSFTRDDEHWPRIRALKDSIDSVTLDVLEWALEAAIDEGEAAVERTAVSTIVREQHDYRASLNTVDCNSVTRVSWAATADPIRNYYALHEIHEGDVYLYNDIHESSGTIGHLPDFCVVVPIFSDGRLIGFSQVFGHCNDVGGKVAGSWPLTATTASLPAASALNSDLYAIIDTYDGEIASPASKRSNSLSRNSAASLNCWRNADTFWSNT